MAPSRPPPASSPAVVAGLRALRRTQPPAQPEPAAERGAVCDLCGNRMDEDHRHLLHLTDRRILCSCEPCWAMRAGDPELRPTGTRMQLLEGFDLSDELWAMFQIPIGLTFFFVTEASGVVALYPSPAGATESELYLEAWNDLVAANPVLEGLEHEVEALIVDRISEPHAYAIVPIDRCYELVGTIKANWQGISGGSAVEDAVGAFFARLGEREGGA
jgi:Family of unknown function (DUF5947)